VGGARTALYNWAFARKHGGRFLLRLEDTDLKRSSEASADGILRDLAWLGITHDDFRKDDPIPRQSQRLDHYNHAVDQLLKSGDAYEQDGAVRFRVTRDVAFDDEVYGHIEVKAADIEDFVIRKGAEGGHYPTFHLAVVVDDFLMEVTHVIRGQEHLSNTPKHVALQRALGYATPIYAHTPSILNPDGSKMSKRDKAKTARAAGKAQGWPTLDIDAARYEAFRAGDNNDGDLAAAVAAALQVTLPEIEVEDFRRSGYLPAVICNYIALLGWNPGGDVEKFDKAFFAEHFALDRINKANSKFDREKLFRFNADALAAFPPDDFAAALRAHFNTYRPGVVEKLGAQFALFAQAYHPRSRTLDEPVALAAFLFQRTDEIAYDGKVVTKTLHKNEAEGLKLLAAIKPALAAVDPWTPAAIHAALEAFTTAHALKNIGAVGQPLRVAVTGHGVSPPIDQTLALLGKAETLARIAHCLHTCRATSA
jgi:glutamyl/glutaminyl-tRNA synthetase